jgi:2-polyprenyl-3-methyl-5-hydroxy-6-metoxy-1,4-benzoquinol methylase
MMARLDNAAAYIEKFKRHAKELGEDEAVKIHVGGAKNYYRMGALERRLLEQLGMLDAAYLIDIGCGSGRLAQTLIDLSNLRFLGVDVVPELVEYCRKTLRQDWRFEVSTNFTIPEADGSADCVTAFSLFTHLLHEETFTYMKDARRVLKPGGRLVFSFLEYAEAPHRALFLRAVASAKDGRALIVFIERNALAFWARELGFEIEQFVSSREKFIEFPQALTLPDGESLAGAYQFGQSICVMRRPA